MVFFPSALMCNAGAVNHGPSLWSQPLHCERVSPRDTSPVKTAVAAGAIQPARTHQVTLHWGLWHVLVSRIKGLVIKSWVHHPTILHAILTLLSNDQLIYY